MGHAGHDMFSIHGANCLLKLLPNAGDASTSLTNVPIQSTTQANLLIRVDKNGERVEIPEGGPVESEEPLDENHGSRLEPLDRKSVV